MRVELGSPCSEALLECLGRRKEAIVRQWLQATLMDYEESASGFLQAEQDRFRNPVGHAFQEALPVLMDSLLLGVDTADPGPVLETVIRMRAVQDFSSSQAVAFILRLKDIVRRDLQNLKGSGLDEGSLAAFGSRIDGMALAASDLFVRCREQISEIKARSARRQAFVAERLAEKSAGHTHE